MSEQINTDASLRVADSAATDSTPRSSQAEALARHADFLKRSFQAKAEQNTAIVQASLDVSISSQNEPLALLYKTAIDSLNKALQTDLGDNAIENAAGQDNTPEGTAGRIVSLSTAFFAAFKEKYAGKSEDELLQGFMNTIRTGFEQGFKEAKDILKGLGVLNGDIAKNIDRTYELVQKGYADFEAANSPAKSNAASATTDAAPAPVPAGDSTLKS